MKFSALLAGVFAAPSTKSGENFVTSGTEFYTEMDSVMGGISQVRFL